MATQITTVRKILDELNGVGKDTPWNEIPQTYTLTSVKVNVVGTADLQPQGVLLKLFINSKTGEIKTYLAKWLDIPEAKLLP
jgi:hypothetical protein